MYKKIVIALALDQGHGKRAIELAKHLGPDGAEIIAVHVIDRVPSFSRIYAGDDESSDAEKKNIIQSAKDAIVERVGDNKDVQVKVLEGHAGRTVVDYADEIGADCIICGAHRPGLIGFFLGSTASRIMSYANCSVHMLRSRAT